MTPQIAIESDASAKLFEELDGKILRVAFTTGCGGSGYRLYSADGPEEGDTILEIGNVILALDTMAAKNLDGATIRWSEEEEGYTLDHPTAVSAVWCG